MLGKAAWIAPAFGAAGYAFGGDLGLIIGLCLGVLPVLGWRFLRHRDELRVTFQKVSGYPSEGPVPVSQLGPASRVMMGMLIAGFLIFPLYAIGIAVAHNSRVVAGLINSLQPVADWLALFVPAFGRMAAALVKKDLADWGAATQHVLAIGWLYLLITIVCIAVDMMIIHPRGWARVGYMPRGPEALNGALAGCAGLALMLVFIFFGLPASDLDTVFDAGLHLPILAAFFDLTVIIVLVLLMWWNARLFRNIEREDDRRQQQLHQEMQSILRDVVRGKPRER